MAFPENQCRIMGYVGILGWQNQASTPLLLRIGWT